MTLKRIEELRRWVEELKGKGQVSSRELERLAQAVGRSRSKRGKEPTYIVPGRLPLSVPYHSRALKRRTKDSILATIEGDLAALEETTGERWIQQNGSDKD